MTFYVEFYAEQAFLSFVKSHLTKETKFDLEDGAVCVLSCTAAIEAILNRLFENDGRLKHYDSLRLPEKIETLADFAKVEVLWGNKPWQDIGQLISVRNWLAHYKNSTIGLINSDSQWVVDDINKKPRLEPGVVLSRKNVTNYYRAVLSGCQMLVTGLDQGLHFGFLSDENYEPIIVG